MSSALSCELLLLLKPSCLQLQSVRSRSCGVALVIAGLIGCTLCLSPPGLSDPRSRFPGRRVGGGTRGECSSRLVAHLVPDNSVYGLSSSGDLAVLLGPTETPVPLSIHLKPDSGAPRPTRIVPAAPAGILVLRVAPVTLPTVWESFFQCASEAAESGNSLAFVSTSFPPAVSLLLPSQSPEDSSVDRAIEGLRRSCGTSVPTEATLSTFGMADVVSPGWPSRLPVLCPS